MTTQELRQAAMECLIKAFNGEDIPTHVTQAATTIVISALPEK